MENITIYNDAMLLMPYFSGSFRDLNIANRSIQSGYDYINEVDDLLGGIWQGRFQMIHNGHYCVFKESLTKFSIKYIAIVCAISVIFSKSLTLLFITLSIIYSPFYLFHIYYIFYFKFLQYQFLE